MKCFKLTIPQSWDYEIWVWRRIRASAVKVIRLTEIDVAFNKSDCAKEMMGKVSPFITITVTLVYLHVDASAVKKFLLRAAVEGGNKEIAKWLLIICLCAEPQHKWTILNKLLPGSTSSGCPKIIPRQAQCDGIWRQRILTYHPNKTSCFNLKHVYVSRPTS